jgi:cytidyltransferase-like protein
MIRHKNGEYGISQVSNHTIWVNGCFDVIHAGYIDMLKYALSFGQRLVVGLDTDERVSSSKGPTNPTHTHKHRIKVMEALRWVDEVVIFPTTPIVGE